MSEDTPQTCCGFIALIGIPNVGKSTLLNRFLNFKLSIVTPKPQTTRRRILGIVVEGGVQLIFMDTPGIFESQARLERAMVKTAWSGVKEADVSVLLIDATNPQIDPTTKSLLSKLRHQNRNLVLALNKIDRLSKSRLLPLVDRLNKLGHDLEIFMISATTGEGVEVLQKKLATLMPVGPWLYPKEQITDLSERLLAAEITRECLFFGLQKELPYVLTVETEAWEEFNDGSVRIFQVIYVERHSQRVVILGKIRQFSETARHRLEKFMQRRVHLKLFIKVRANWKEERERYLEMGLPFKR